MCSEEILAMKKFSKAFTETLRFAVERFFDMHHMYDCVVINLLGVF